LKIPLSWLRDFVDVTESVAELTEILDDLGLVVEGVEIVGENLEDVIVARVEEIRAIEGADRVRLVVVDAGDGLLEIVCGATNFAVGNFVPLAPVGAVLPGGFEIAERKMRGATSHGMLCSARELRLSDDHEGLMILDELTTPVVGEKITDALSIRADVVFEISVEGNRPDAWSVEGVARDLATRLGRELRSPPMASPNSAAKSADFASAGIDAPDLCGRLTLSVLRNVQVKPSPTWIGERLRNAGMRPISNVVDASNFVMLELGQPTHPYDAQHVARHTLRVRRAREGEMLTTLDGVQRKLAKPGRGLGDTGEDCVIVDGDDVVIGLAGIMGGSSSEINVTTTDVLLEAAFFDPMGIARSSKRHGLRSEASNRFERGVDPQLALRAAARFVALLLESVPDLEWLSDPLDELGIVPDPSSVILRPGDVERSLGVEISGDEIHRLLEGLNFRVEDRDDTIVVTPPSARLDVRAGTFGRADVIEEIARLHSYRRLPRRMPSWPEPGAFSERQILRRRLRGVIVDLGGTEVWTPSLISDAQFDFVHPNESRVRVTNPLATDESVLRATLVTGIVQALGKNVERGKGEVILTELGTVFVHPDATDEPRITKGGDGGGLILNLPRENERVSVLLARAEDSAITAVAMWSVISQRLGLSDVVVRSNEDPVRFMHPTRAGLLVDRVTGTVFGSIGELDQEYLDGVASNLVGRRIGVLDVDLDLLAEHTRVLRRSDFVGVPSRYPSALFDLAFITPVAVHAQDLAFALRSASELIEDVRLFDVYVGAGLPSNTRSLAYAVRVSSAERTLSESDVAALRDELIATGGRFGAQLR
jgi:phenylalanyl-tRNA synthetase beta chain